MSLSPQRKIKCLEIIDSLLRYKTSAFFAYPINPILDNCPNYFVKIKKPMDLLTVQSNLINDKYHTFSDFCADVDLIWANACEFNGENSIISILAGQMKIWFHQMIFLMSDDEISDWVTQLHDLQNQVSTLSKQNALIQDQMIFANGSDNESEIIPEEKIIHTNSSFNNESHLYASKNTGKFPLNEVKDVCKEKHVRNGIQPKNNSKSSQKKSSNINTNLNQSNEDQPYATTKNYRHQKKSQRIISANQLIELHRIITQLDDAEKLLKILNIIRKYEPKLNVNERSSINMNDLSMITRVKIYDLIQKMDE